MNRLFRINFVVAVAVLTVLGLLSRNVTEQMALLRTVVLENFRADYRQVGLNGLINESDPRAHCCNLLDSFKATLEMLCRADGSIQIKDFAKRAEAQRCTCIDFFYCKLVVVTAFSNNHFKEAYDMIASVQKFLPSTKLIVYDLGMSAEQNTKLHQYCNIEVRPFLYEKYPPHIRNLEVYAWKIFIIKEITSEHEVLLWGDASARVLGPFFGENVFPYLLKFPFMAGSTAGLPIVSLTHDGMLQYLKLSLSRKQMGHFGHIKASCWIMWANSLMKTKFLNYWFDCGLHEACIAPPGATKRNCNFTLGPYKGSGDYIGCHRFDQSAMSMILIREFGLTVWDLAVHEEEAKKLLIVKRTVVTHELVKYCDKLNSTG